MPIPEATAAREGADAPLPILRRYGPSWSTTPASWPFRADPLRAGPRAAIRRQLPGPLRADGRAPHGARGGRQGADRLAELERAPAQPGRLRGPGLPVPSLHPRQAYAESKTAAVMLAVEATRRWS